MVYNICKDNIIKHECNVLSIEEHHRCFRLGGSFMVAVLAVASYSRIGLILYFSVRTRSVRVPGGSKFHLEPGTMHPCWNLTAPWCLWSCSNFLKVAFVLIRDREGGDVWCCNPSSLNPHLPSNIKIYHGLLCIWASGGGCPLSWFFWA